MIIDRNNHRTVEAHFGFDASQRNTEGLAFAVLITPRNLGNSANMPSPLPLFDFDSANRAMPDVQADGE
jgi:hypothetical protein